jgi:hypothetical protein
LELINFDEAVEISFNNNGTFNLKRAVVGATFLHAKQKYRFSLFSSLFYIGLNSALLRFIIIIIII